MWSCASNSLAIACQEAVILQQDFAQPVAGSMKTLANDNGILEIDPNAIPITTQTNLFEPIQLTQTPFAEPQCITVKKNPLGCLEGIAVLPQDEVWLVDARSCLCGETDTGLLNVSKLTQDNFSQSEMSCLTTSHAADQDRVTVIYIHGNQTNLEYAIARGMQVYRNAFAAKAHCRVPVRFVIWAWKSEQEKARLYPDYLIKSERSVLLGETLATTLNQFDDRNLLVFGYSLGVQVALSAFDSPLLNSRSDDPTRYHVAFAAPAINAEYVACHALSLGGRTPISQTFVFTNRKDRAIRAAQAIIRRKSMIDEASIEGLSRAGKLDVGAISSIEISEEAGPFHSVERYTRSEKLQSSMASLVNAVSASRLIQTIQASE